MNEALLIGYTYMDSPIGNLTVAATREGLCAVLFGDAETAEAQLFRLATKWSKHASIIKDDVLPAPYVEELIEYFAGTRKSFASRLHLLGTPFQVSVWEALRNIPYGETCSYKHIAERIGSPKAVRAVGGANNKNPLPIVIPCHRVVGMDGKLVGYGGGLGIKEYLLSLETAQQHS